MFFASVLQMYLSRIWKSNYI